MNYISWMLLILNIFFENLGIPLPTELSYVLASVQIRQGKSILLMLLVLTLAHLLGSATAFWLGWWGKGWLSDRLQHSARFHKASTAIHQWYSKRGYTTVFALRFVGYLRPWSSLVAGFARMNWLPFILLTLAGTLIFNIIALLFTLELVNWWTRFGNIFKIVSVVLFIISLSIIFWVEKYWHRSSEGNY